MLKVRPEQLEVFQPLMDEGFVNRVVEFLKVKHSDVVIQLSTGTSFVKEIPCETLHKMVQNGIARARDYGMSWESTLASFVVMMFLVAPNFDDHPIIQQLLRNEKADPNARIDQICEQLNEADWEAAKRAYDAMKWNL